MKVLHECSFDVEEKETGFSFWCPGCESYHGIPVTGPKAWGWNGNEESPTFSPSILVTMGPLCDPVTHLAIPGAPDRVCHSFIINGNWQFLGDCWHDLKGQIVPMVEWDHEHS